jgi:hypothetical protein
LTRRHRAKNRDASAGLTAVMRIAERLDEAHKLFRYRRRGRFRKNASRRSTTTARYGPNSPIIFRSPSPSIG